MKEIRWPIVCLLLSLLIFGCASSHSTSQEIAPDFELKDLAGHVVKLQTFRGHPVLLDFWATWCGPCRMSIPMVQKFYERHKDQGLVVIGMNVDDDPGDVPAFVKTFHMTYPVLLAGPSSASSDYRVEGIPSFVFIDPAGHIVDRFEGFSREMTNEWESDFQRLATPPARQAGATH